MIIAPVDPWITLILIELFFTIFILEIFVFVQFDFLQIFIFFFLISHKFKLVSRFYKNPFTRKFRFDYVQRKIKES